MGIVLLAICCAVAFHTRVYKQFDPTRIMVVDAEQFPADGLMVVPLPDAARRLAGTWTAVVLRLANRSPDTRIVRITVGTTAIDRVILRPGRTSQVNLGVLVRWDADINDRMVLRGNGSGWVLEYLELGNLYRSSGGVVSFLIVPDRAMPADRPPKDSAVFVFLLLLALPLGLRSRREPGTRATRAAMAFSAAAGVFLVVTLVLPVVSPYKVLLSVHAFWLCVATIYVLPVAPRAAGAAALWLTAGFSVLWRRGVGPALRFGRMLPGRVGPWLTAGFGVLSRRGIGPALRFGTDLAIWPIAAARCLATSRRRILVGGIGVLLASTVALFWLVSALRSTPPTYPETDMAVLEIYTLLASDGHLSVGPYSRWGWNHPGPAYFYALAPLHALTGHEFSLHWTVLFLNLVSAVAVVVLLMRYGGWPFGLGLIGALSIYFFQPNPAWSLRLLVDVWNPNAVMLPFAVLLVLCARLASGVIRVLPWIVGVASFVAQTHIAVAPSTAAVTASAALLYFLRRRMSGRNAETTGTDPDKRPGVFWIHAAIWVFLLLWSLPLLEQLRAGPDGNLAQVLSFFVADSHSERPTMATSFNALSYALWIPISGTAPTITGLNPSAAVWTCLQLVLLAAGGVWAALARRAFPAALCFIGLVAAGAAFWSITQVRGELFGYLLRWIFMVSVVNTAALLGLIMDRAAGALSLHRIRGLRVLSVAKPVAAGTFGVFLTVQSALVMHALQQRTLDGDSYLNASSVRVLFAAVEEDLRRHCLNRPLIRIQSNSRWPDAAGVALQLYKAGIPLAIDDRYLFMFTETFAATGVEDVEFLFADVALDVSETPPYRLVAQATEPTWRRSAPNGTFVYARDVPGARRNSLESGC